MHNLSKNRHWGEKTTNSPPRVTLYRRHHILRHSISAILKHYALRRNLKIHGTARNHRSLPVAGQGTLDFLDYAVRAVVRVCSSTDPNDGLRR